MNDERGPLARFCFTGLAMLAELAHLAWEHFHGGVVRHHLLHRADMPAISNWWGLLLLPALAWFLVGRIQRRIALDSDGHGATSSLPVRVVAGFVCSLVIGILLSVSFTTHHESVASYLFLGILLLAVVLPVYRAECVLGFVLGMTLTFGAVLPTMFGSIIGAVSAAIHLLLRPGLARLWDSFKRTRSRPA
jgi:hypothetical protein